MSEATDVELQVTPAAEPVVIHTETAPAAAENKEADVELLVTKPAPESPPRAPIGKSGVTQHQAIFQVVLSVANLGLFSGVYAKGATVASVPQWTGLCWFSLLFGVVQLLSGIALCEETFPPASEVLLLPLNFNPVFKGETVTAILRVASALGLIALGFAVKAIEIQQIGNSYETAAISLVIISALFTLYLGYGKFTMPKAKGVHAFLALVQLTLGVLLVGLISGNAEKWNKMAEFTSMQYNNFVYGLLFAVIQTLSGITWFQHLDGKNPLTIDIVVAIMVLAAGTGLLALGYACKSINFEALRLDLVTTVASFTIINACFTFILALVVLFVRGKDTPAQAAPFSLPNKLLTVLQLSLAITLFGLQAGYIQITWQSAAGESVLQNTTHMFGLVFAVMDTFTAFVVLVFSTGKSAHGPETVYTLLKITTALGFLSLGFACQHIDVEWQALDNLEVCINSFIIINAITVGHLAFRLQKGVTPASQVTHEFAKYVAIGQTVLSLLLIGLVGGYVQMNSSTHTLILTLIFAVLQFVSGLGLLEQAFGTFCAHKHANVVAVLKLAAVLGLLATGFFCKTINEWNLEMQKGAKYDFGVTIGAIVILNSLVTVYLAYLSNKNLIFGVFAFSVSAEGRAAQFRAYVQVCLGVLLIGLIGGCLNIPGMEEALGAETTSQAKINTYWFALLFAVLQTGSGYALLHPQLKSSAMATLKTASAVAWIALSFVCHEIFVGVHPATNNLETTIYAFTIVNTLYTVYLSYQGQEEARVADNKIIGLVQLVFGILLLGLIAGQENKSVSEPIPKLMWHSGRVHWFTLLFAVLETIAGAAMVNQAGGLHTLFHNFPVTNITQDTVVALNRITSAIGLLALGLACKHIDYKAIQLDLATTIAAFTIINSILSTFVDFKVAAKGDKPPAATEARVKLEAVTQLVFSIILFGLISGLLNKDPEITKPNDATGFIVQSVVLFGILFSAVQFWSGFSLIANAIGKIHAFGGLQHLNYVNALLGLLATGFACRAIGVMRGDTTDLFRCVIAFILINTSFSVYLVRKPADPMACFK